MDLTQLRDTTKRAFDEFKIRWIPPVPLVYPQPAGFFFLGVFADEKKTSGPACIDASRLISQSAVSFQIRLVANPSGKTQRIHRTHPKAYTTYITFSVVDDFAQSPLGEKSTIILSRNHGHCSIGMLNLHDLQNVHR